VGLLDQGKKRPRIIWSVLLGVAMIGMLGALFIPAAAGIRLDPMTGYHSMIWGSLFFWAVWRYRLKTGWHGGLLGAGVGLLLWMLAVFISGYVRASGGG